MEHGIDVAWPQGDYDWSRQRGRISFGMAKATEGTGLGDPHFKHNWDSMWELQPDRRLPRFAYHFFRAGQPPVAQAQFLVRTVRNHGLLPGDNFVMDLEATHADGSNDGMSPAETAARAAVFLHTVNALAPGHRVLVYTYPAFARTGAVLGLGAWYLWIANYGVPAPAVPEPWSQWTFWQDSDDPIDTDRFTGDLAQLLAFTRMPDKR